MSSRFPLQPLLDLSQMRLDLAARELGALIAGEHQASTRLALLVQYRDEYHGRFLAAAERGIGLGEWSNYTRFIARIDDAIVTATASVAQTQQRTVAGQMDWKGKHGRLRAFSTLADRHQALAAEEEQRAAQKSSDEFGARRQAGIGSGFNPFQPYASDETAGYAMA